MAKSVNIKLFATVYKLNKKLDALLTAMKKDIVAGANQTYASFAEVKVVECTKRSWSKEAQALADEYLTSLGYEKQETKYNRVDIDNINEVADAEVDAIINTLEASNDKLIARVAAGTKR